MFSITKDGKKLSKDLYTRDEKTKTLSTNECWLVLDFSDCSDCTFYTSYGCTFDTSSNCTFKTDSDCTFKTGSNCTFKTGYYCVVVRRDIYEVVELEENKTIKLNWYLIKWYTNIGETHTIKIDWKEIELSEESYQSFKKQFE